MTSPSPHPQAAKASAPFPATARLSAQALADQLAAKAVRVIDVREPMEVASGLIAGSVNIPLSKLARTELPPGPLVLVCQSGNRSARGVQLLRQQGHPHPVTDLEGGIASWQQAGLPLRRMPNAPLPLMRQVQIAAGSLVLLGLILSQALAQIGRAHV